MALYSNVKVLAVDEVDVTGGSDWTKALAWQFMDNRYAKRSQVATLIATNTHPNDLPGYLGSRAEDGLRIEVQGQSLRGANAKG